MKPKIYISACLLGHNVRYDSGHKKEEWIVDRLSQFFELVPICPEVEMGLGIPREPVQLVHEDSKIKMVSVKNRVDHTENAINTSINILNNFKDACGLILMKNSPSCGIERVKVYLPNQAVMINAPKENQVGIFAKKAKETYPLLPIIESGRLYNQEDKNLFLRQAMAYYRFINLKREVSELQDFHKRYKFILMEHDPEEMTKLGQISANSSKLSVDEVFHLYLQKLMKCLRKYTTKGKVENTFFHLLGFFKNELSLEDKKIIHEMILDYKKNLLPYSVPLKMLEFLIKKYQHAYLLNHYILDPYPKDLRDEKSF